MDLNYLFRREQISLVNAERAEGRSARAAMARGYVEQIAEKHSLYRFRTAPALPTLC